MNCLVLLESDYPGGREALGSATELDACAVEDLYEARRRFLPRL